MAQRFLCYTLRMSENQHIWNRWARVLHRWGLNEGMAHLLEGSGSLSLLAAQALYLSQPLLSGFISEQTLQAFSQVLEDPAEKRSFVSFLREVPSSGTGA